MTCSSSSSRPQHLFFFFLLLLFIPFLSLAQPITINIDSSIWNLPSNATCLSQQSNFSGSLFSNNLNRLVSLIPSHQPNTYNFYSFLVGDQEQVEAVGLCNRVLTRVDCLNCISQAAANLTTTYCPAHRETYVRATKCMFRYSDKPIFGKLERVPALEAPNPNDATGDRNGTGPSPNTTFFAAVQCTPDLSEKDCNDCLNYGFKNATKGRLGLRWFCSSCSFQIESNLRFFVLESEYESDIPRKPRPEQSKRRRVLALATLVFIKLCYNKQSTQYIMSLSTFVLKRKFCNLNNKIRKQV